MVLNLKGVKTSQVWDGKMKIFSINYFRKKENRAAALAVSACGWWWGGGGSGREREEARWLQVGGKWVLGSVGIAYRDASV